jgi:hypothetical protein
MYTNSDLSTPSDRRRVENLVKSRIGNRIRALRLVFKDAGVVLRGFSETYHAKQLAQHAAMQFAVPVLANEIVVK